VNGGDCGPAGGPAIVAVDPAELLRHHVSLIEALPDAVIATDLDFRATVWNPAAERLYGYTAEEAIGRPARELATYEDDAARRELEVALDETGRAHVELRARRKCGAFMCVELIATAVRDEDGAVVGYLGIHRDVTEQKRTEAERRRLSAIVQHSADLIGMADLDGRIVFVNEAGRRLVGLGVGDEVRTKHVLDLVAPEQRDRVRDRVLPQILADGRGLYELEFVNFETGDRIPVSCEGFRVDYALDRDFRFAYVNDRAVRALGDGLGTRLEREDVLGSELFAMSPGLAGTDVERCVRRAMRERRTIASEYLDPASGRWFDIHAYPAEDGLAVYLHEITDRKLGERARERQAARPRPRPVRHRPAGAALLVAQLLPVGGQDEVELVLRVGPAHREPLHRDVQQRRRQLAGGHAAKARKRVDHRPAVAHELGRPGVGAELALAREPGDDH
jgi:PAS domain S-box-containing protein